MLIAIDCRMLEREKGGLYVILSNMLESLSGIDDGNIYHLFFDKLPDPLTVKKSKKFIYRKILGPLWLKRSFVFTTQILLPISLARDKFDLFYSPYYFGPIFSTAKKNIISPWDISYSTHPHHYSLKIRLLLHILSKLTCRRANGLVTCSEYDKDVIAKTYKIISNKIFVLPLSVDSYYFERVDDNNLRNYLMDCNIKKNKYILSIGTIYNRRNVDVLINAFKSISKDNPGLSLVVVGRNMTNPYINFEQLIFSNGLQRVVLHMERATDAELRMLYQGAMYTYCTSTVDGETIIIKESLASGTPVITNNLLINSVNGNAVICKDPTSVETVERTLHSAISNYDANLIQAMRGREYVKNLTWDSSTIRFIVFINKIFNNEGKFNE